MYRILPDHKVPRREMMLSDIRIEKRFIGGIIKKVGSYFFGDMTQRVKNFMKQHGDEKITSLELGRTPISSMLNKTINAISGGSFDEGKKKLGYDDFYHLFLIINGRYKLEKNQNLNITDYKKASDEENESLSAPDITINEFIKKGVDKVGSSDFFGNYSALNQNCQWLLKNLLNANGISSGDKFIYQDIKDLKESMPITGAIADEATDLASGIDKLISYISDGKLGLKRGGRVHGYRNKKYLI